MYINELWSEKSMRQYLNRTNMSKGKYILKEMAKEANKVENQDKNKK